MTLDHCRPNLQGRLQKWSQLSVAPAIHTVSVSPPGSLGFLLYSTKGGRTYCWAGSETKPQEGLWASDVSFAPLNN